MKGAAEVWLRPHHEQRNFNEQAAFIKPLKAGFGETDAHEVAKLGVKAFCQTSSVNEYWTRFPTDKKLLNWKEQALKKEFFEGLHPKSETSLPDLLTNLSASLSLQPMASNGTTSYTRTNDDLQRLIFITIPAVRRQATHRTQPEAHQDTAMEDSPTPTTEPHTDATPGTNTPPDTQGLYA